jgi:ABC-2 type transport system permease protein
VPELVGRIALWVVILPVGLVFGALAGLGAFHVVRVRAGLQAEIGTAALFFGIWQTWTVVGLSLADRDLLDLRRFLVYPIPTGRVYAYGLAASVVGDPFALFWSLILLGAFVGAGVARPGAWLVLLALVFLAFAAGVVTLLALLQEGLARALRSRLARSVAVAGVYVGIGLALTWASRAGLARVSALARSAAGLRWIVFPPALATRAARELYAGEAARALPWLFALGACATLAGWVAFRLALAGARGGGEATARGGGVGQAGWRLPGRLAPLLEKELKYLLRHPLVGVLILVLPGVAGVVGLIPVRKLSGDLERGFMLVGFALYVHLATQAFWLNALGWDRGGVRTWFLAPVPLADVLLAKNRAMFLLGAALFAVSAAAMVAAGGAPAPWALAAAVALHLGIAPWYLTAGNFVSILNPRTGIHSVQRGGRLPPASALAGMAIVSAGAALFGGPVLLAVRLEAPWAMAVAWVALGLVGVAVHRATLPPLARLLYRRREAVLAAVAGDEE